MNFTVFAMKKLSVLCALLLPVCALQLPLCAAAGNKSDIPFPERKAFSNVGVSAGISLDGPGISVSTPISRSVNLRADYHLLPIFLTDEVNADPPYVAKLPDGKAFEINPESAKLSFNSHVFRLLVDWTPFKKGAGSVFLTGGILLQNTRVFRYSQIYDTSVFADFGVTGDELTRVEIIRHANKYNLNENGAIDSYVRRPEFGLYVGLTFGRPIPKRRVGVRGEIGCPIYFGMWEAYGNGPVMGAFPVPGNFYRTGPVSANLYISVHVTVRLLKDK